MGLLVRRGGGQHHHRLTYNISNSATAITPIDNQIGLKRESIGLSAKVINLLVLKYSALRIPPNLQ